MIAHKPLFFLNTISRDVKKKTKEKKNIYETKKKKTSVKSYT